MIATVALVIAALALLLAGACALRLRTVQRRFTVLWGDGPPRDVAATLHRHAARVDTVEQRLGTVDGDVARLGGLVAQGLRHVSVVRYDAFGDMGGRLSFSAALLDDAGDGLVLSAVHGRGESRTYAKGIAAGKSQIALTPEEQQALATARADRPDA